MSFGGAKAEDDETHSLLGGAKGSSCLVDEFEERKRLFRERGFDAQDPKEQKNIFSLMHGVKKLKEVHGLKLKLDRELAYDDLISTKCNTLAMLAIISVVLYVIHMEANFDREDRYMENDTAGSLTMRFLMSAVTALMLCALFDYYIVTQFIWRKFQCTDPDESSWPREVWFEFLFQCAVILIHPVPGLIDNKLGSFVFVRLYVVLLVLRNYSELYLKRGIVYESGHLKRGGKRIDAALCIKVHVDNSPAVCLAIVFMTLLLTISYGNYICEREGLNGEGLTYMKTLWNTSFLFFRGVSRFDNSNSTAGRVIELATASLGVVALAIVVALVTEIMEVSAAEDFALTWMERHKSKTRAETYAAELIQAAWRMHQLRTKSPEDLTPEVELFFASLIKRHSKFREERSSQENLSLDLCHDKCLEMGRELSSVVDDIQDIKDSQDDLLETFDLIDDYIVVS